MTESEFKARMKMYKLHEEVLDLIVQCNDLYILERFNSGSLKNLKMKKRILTRVINGESVSDEDLESILNI